MFKMIKYTICKVVLYIFGRKRMGGYYIKEIVDVGELNSVYKFRYWLYCEVDHLLNASDYPEKQESDGYDAFSKIFAAFNNRGEVIACFRLIDGLHVAIPTTKEYSISAEEINEYTTGKKFVEISRFMIHPEYRGSRLIIDLYKAAFLYSTKEGIEFWFGCVEDWFLNGFKKYTKNVVVIGSGKFCFNSINYPFYIDVQKLKEEMSRKFIGHYFNFVDRNVFKL